MSRMFLIPFLMVLLMGVTSQSFATNTPTIELEKTVHFLTPGGEDVKLSPGTYQVDVVALKGNPGGEQQEKVFDPDTRPNQAYSSVRESGFKAICRSGQFQAVPFDSSGGGSSSGRIGCLRTEYKNGRIHCQGNDRRVSVPGRDYCGTPGAVVEKPACPLNAKRLTVMSGRDRCGKRIQSVFPRCDNGRSHAYKVDKRGAEDQCIPKKVPIAKNHCEIFADMSHRKVLGFELYEDRLGAEDVCEFHYLYFQRPEIQ